MQRETVLRSQLDYLPSFYTAIKRCWFKTQGTTDFNLEYYKSIQGRVILGLANGI